MITDRSKLPYRKNCEGYFLYGSDQILARDSGFNYVEFPGGGVDGDDIAAGMLRETLEETGANISGLKEIGLLYFDWAPDWARTDKQKQRYNHFRGEEMHLFVGRISKLGAPHGDPESGENGWAEHPLVDRDWLIQRLEQMKPYPHAMAEYYAKQLWIVQNIDSLV